MNAKISVFVICVEVIMYLLLCNGCIFKVKHSVEFSWFYSFLHQLIYSKKEARRQLVQRQTSTNCVESKSICIIVIT